MHSSLPRDDEVALIHCIAKVFRFGENDFRTIVETLREGSWNANAPFGTTFTNIVPRIVHAASVEGWLRDLVVHLAHKYPGCPEFLEILKRLDARTIVAHTRLSKLPSVAKPRLNRQQEMEPDLDKILDNPSAHIRTKRD